MHTSSVEKSTRYEELDHADWIRLEERLKEVMVSSNKTILKVM